MTGRARRGALLVTLAMVPAALHAQRVAPPVRFQVGVEVGALHSTHPYESGPIGLGGFVALEREWSTRLATRATLGLTESVSTGDDLSVCRPYLPDQCYPDGNYPLRVGSLEVHGLIAPDRSLPFRLLAGGGLAYLVGVHRNVRVTEHLGHDRTLKGVARAGVDARLGRSPQAPRLQYTRAWLTGSYESLDRLDALGLVIVF